MTATRQLFSSGAAWEPIIGYSRAVRVGNVVEVSGTTGVVEDGDMDMYSQTKRTLEKIGVALADAGAAFEDVVRTRMFLTDISQWEAAGRAHGEVFGAIRPATAMVEVRAQIDPRMLVEIEVTAIITS